MEQFIPMDIVDFKRLARFLDYLTNPEYLDEFLSVDPVYPPPGTPYLLDIANWVSDVLKNNKELRSYCQYPDMFL